MLQYEKSTSPVVAVFRFGDLLFHSTVRVVRKSSRNALLGLFNNIMQSVLMIAVFVGILGFVVQKALKNRPSAAMRQAHKKVAAMAAEMRASAGAPRKQNKKGKKNERNKSSVASQRLVI